MASTIITNIITHLEERMDAVLPTAFTKLSHVIDITKNKFKGASNRYGVKPLGGSQNDLNLGSYAVDQEFELILSNSYKSSKLINDVDQRAKAIELQDYVQDVYKEVKQNRALTFIKQVFDLRMDEPEYDEDNHLVIQRFTITIKYQNSLR